MIITYLYSRVHTCIITVAVIARHCMLPLNRDKNGAINIGHNFQRLMRDESPIKAMTEEEGGLSPRTNVQ